MPIGPSVRLLVFYNVQLNFHYRDCSIYRVVTADMPPPFFMIPASIMSQSDSVH